MNSPMRMSEDWISLALRCVDVRRRSRFRPLMTSRPTTPMYIGRDVVGSRCLSPSASRQKMFHQLATMAMSRAIARHGFRSFVTNPPQPYWFLCPRFSASHMFSSPPQLSAFLVSEDRLYGIVDVDYVLEGQQSVEDVLLVSREPRVQLATVSRLERAPYAVLADDPPKSEQCRKHRVVSRPVDVDVPRKSADDREHGRADDVADIGGVRTRVMKRRVLDESVEETARLQIGNEVRQPSPLRDLRFRTPADVELASKRRNVDSLRMRGTLK